MWRFSNTILIHEYLWIYYSFVQVHVIRFGNVGGVADDIKYLLHVHGCLACLGRRAVPSARTQRHRPLYRTLCMRSPFPVPLESTIHEDACYTTYRSCMGNSLVGNHCPYYGKEKSIYYALSKMLPVKKGNYDLIIFKNYTFLLSVRGAMFVPVVYNYNCIKYSLYDVSVDTWYFISIFSKENCKTFCNKTVK